MKKKFVFFALFFVLFSLGSEQPAHAFGKIFKRKPKPRPTPTATPTPTPTPTPSTRGPLTVNGNKFYNALGNQVYLAGAVVCCDQAEVNGWPLVTTQALSTMSANGANYTHIRTGPFAGNESPVFQGYVDTGGGRFDLNQWNAAFWTSLRNRISYARSIGVYVEVDVIDAWVLKHPELSPWTAANNVNGLDQGSCNILSRAPRATQIAWIRKVVAETGEFDNVIYQIGNETFDCRTTTPAWEFGVASIVRSELAAHGFGNRLIGTNSNLTAVENDGQIDYIATHDQVPQPGGSKPTVTNEVNGAFAAEIGPAGYESRLREAYAMGSYWQLWRGDMVESQYNDALARLKRFRQEIGQR